MEANAAVKQLMMKTLDAIKPDWVEVFAESGDLRAYAQQCRGMGLSEASDKRMRDSAQEMLRRRTLNWMLDVNDSLERAALHMQRAEHT